MSTIANRFREQFDDAAQQLPGLEGARRAAIDRFVALGLPTPRHEDWKYTRITPLEKREFHLASMDQTAPELGGEAKELGLSGFDAHVLTFVNGRFDPSLSRMPYASSDTGFDIRPIGEALRAGDEVVAPYLTAGEDAHSGDVTAFTALNTAFVHDGVFIRARPNAALKQPLYLRFIACPGETSLATHPRIVIDLDEGASLDLIESFSSTGRGSHFNNVYADVRLAPGACLRHCKLHEEGDTGVHIATTYVRQAERSRYLSLSIALDGQLVRNDINCELLGTGAECSLDGLFMGAGRSHIDYHTRVDHKVPGARSDELYKSVLGGRARGVFNGRVYVHPDAQATEAHQKNDNLLLSRHAEIDTKPQLEIYADDVKCSHGATVGQLDADALFYLRTRGIDEQAARALLIYGFAHDVLKRLPITGLSEALTPRVLAHLGQFESGGAAGGSKSVTENGTKSGVEAITESITESIAEVLA